MLEIREATVAEIPEMHRIRLAVRENRLSDPSWLTPEVYEACLQPAGTANTWVARRGGSTVGFATARVTEQDIWALFVDPEFEGQGIGRALLDTATDWLFDHGAGEIQLATGPETRADQMYRNAGWKRGETAPNGDVRYRLTRPALAGGSQGIPKC